eukprot:4131374-Pyramimonas_sp.AAC.1
MQRCLTTLLLERSMRLMKRSLNGPVQPVKLRVRKGGRTDMDLVPTLPRFPIPRRKPKFGPPLMDFIRSRTSRGSNGLSGNVSSSMPSISVSCSALGPNCPTSAKISGHRNSGARERSLS